MEQMKMFGEFESNRERARRIWERVCKRRFEWNGYVPHATHTRNMIIYFTMMLDQGYAIIEDGGGWRIDYENSTYTQG